jgi:hypothetical protein
MVPPASASLVAISFVTVVAKLGSSPKAAANSLSVSSVAGLLSTTAVIALFISVVVSVLSPFIKNIIIVRWLY